MRAGQGTQFYQKANSTIVRRLTKNLYEYLELLFLSRHVPQIPHAKQVAGESL